MNSIEKHEVQTFRADIFIAGSVESARNACLEFCMEGLCVNFSECDFVYTGGFESEVRVGLIHYPRFPSTRQSISETAIRLAEHLIVPLHQLSASVVCDDTTTWLTRRPK